MSNLSDFTGGSSGGGPASNFINLNDVSGIVDLDINLYGKFELNVVDDVEIQITDPNITKPFTVLAKNGGSRNIDWDSTNFNLLDTNKGAFSNPYETAGITLISKGDISANSSNGIGISFKPDGRKFYILEYRSIPATNEVREFDLSVPWDLSTISYNSVVFDLTTSQTDEGSSSIFFKPDGTKFYSNNFTNGNVYEYDMSTPWDLSTATYNSVLLDTALSDAFNISISDDGSTMIMYNRDVNAVYQYTMTEPWDLSTASQTNVAVISELGGTDTYVGYSDNGNKLLSIDNINQIVKQFELSSPYDLDSYTYTGVTSNPIDVSDTISFYIRPGGEEIYLIDNSSDEILKCAFANNRALYKFYSDGSSLFHGECLARYSE